MACTPAQRICRSDGGGSAVHLPPDVQRGQLALDTDATATYVRPPVLELEPGVGAPGLEDAPELPAGAQLTIG